MLVWLYILQTGNFSLLKHFCGLMKPQIFIKQIFLKDEISSRIIPLLSTCSSGSILDRTALDKSLTTTPSLTTTAYQSCSLRDSNTPHALALQLLHPKWMNKNGNRKSNSPFITLPLVVLAAVQSSYMQQSCRAYNGELKIKIIITVSRKLFRC